MAEEEKEPPDPCPEVKGVWDVVEKGHNGDGHAGWTCAGCGNFFNGLNATKAAAHVLLLGGFSIVPCMSWRKIPAAKLDKLRMIHTKAEVERERRARKRRAEEAAALSENNSAAGAALSSQTKRASASRDSESGPGGMPLSGGTPPLPPSSQPPILLHRVARRNRWRGARCGIHVVRATCLTRGVSEVSSTRFCLVQKTGLSIPGQSLTRAIRARWFHFRCRNPAVWLFSGC